MVDVEALLKETPSEPPCGPDLEYDAEFLELDQVSRGKPEQQFGETIIPAEEPNWADVAQRAEGLLARSKDLRIAALLARARLHTEQFAGLQPAMELIRLMLERHWDHVHPRLDPEDGDATMRLNALAGLGDSEGLLRDLRGAALVRSRNRGQLLVREIEVVRGSLAPRPGETPLPAGQLEAILAGAAADGEFPATSVSSAIQAVAALSTLLNERVGSDRAPDLKPLLTTLRVLDDAVKAALPAAAEAGDAEAGAAGAPGMLNVRTGEVGSRQDALVLVDKIIAYFERNEPSNPAPLILKRAKRLMTMNFVDIIKDLVPDGMDRINTIAGLSGEE